MPPSEDMLKRLGLWELRDDPDGLAEALRSKAEDLQRKLEAADVRRLERQREIEAEMEELRQRLEKARAEVLGEHGS